MKTEKFDHFTSILDSIETNDIFDMFGPFRTKEYSPNEFASYLCDLYYAVESAANEIEYTLCEVTNPSSYSETIINKVARTAMSYRPNTFLNLLNIFDINDIDSYSENEIDEIIDNATSWMSVVNLQQCIWLSASLELFAKIRTPFSRNGIDISSILAKHEELFYEEDILYVDSFYSNQGIDSDKSEPVQNNLNKQHNLENATVALICIYTNQPISNINAEEILKSFGIEGKKVKKLIEAYNKYIHKDNRTSLFTRKADDYHKKRLQNVINYLQSKGFDSTKAEREYDEFNKRYNTHYEE